MQSLMYHLFDNDCKHLLALAIWSVIELLTCVHGDKSVIDALLLVLSWGLRRARPAQQNTKVTLFDATIGEAHRANIPHVCGSGGGGPIMQCNQ